LNQCLRMSSVNTWKIITRRQETSCRRQYLWYYNHTNSRMSWGFQCSPTRGRHRVEDPLWGSGRSSSKGPTLKSQACAYFLFRLFLSFWQGDWIVLFFTCEKQGWCSPVRFWSVFQQGTYRSNRKLAFDLLFVFLSASSMMIHRNHTVTLKFWNCFCDGRAFLRRMASPFVSSS
jgi:hypothetical protein